MADFTPGPWKVELDHDEQGNETGYACVFAGDFERASYVPKPDAHLIAAAPELLDACKQLTEFARRQGWFHVAIEAGESAIAKAEGRES